MNHHFTFNFKLNKVRCVYLEFERYLRGVLSFRILNLSRTIFVKRTKEFLNEDTL